MSDSKPTISPAPAQFGSLNSECDKPPTPTRRRFLAITATVPAAFALPAAAVPPADDTILFDITRRWRALEQEDLRLNEEYDTLVYEISRDTECWSAAELEEHGFGRDRNGFIRVQDIDDLDRKERPPTHRYDEFGVRGPNDFWSITSTPLPVDEAAMQRWRERCMARRALHVRKTADYGRAYRACGADVVQQRICAVHQALDGLFTRITDTPTSTMAGTLEKIRFYMITNPEDFNFEDLEPGPRLLVGALHDLERLGAAS